MHPALLVFIYGSITALATGLGALPFAFVRTVSIRTTAYANAIAAGLMLGASFGLVAEGTEHGVWQTIIGVNVGVAFILVTQLLLARRDVHFGSLEGASAQRMVLIIIVMTVHSIAEGIAVGASFAGGIRLATFITVAIAVHNIPEGIAISAVLRSRGVSVATCAGWSIFSSLPQPLMAVPAYLFVDAFAPALPYSVGFAAGAMVYMVLVELLPEAYEEAPRPAIGLVVTVTLVAMLLLQRYL
jgi:zinc transporter ZupT